MPSDYFPADRTREDPWPRPTLVAIECALARPARKNKARQQGSDWNQPRILGPRHHPFFRNTSYIPQMRGTHNRAMGTEEIN